MKTRRSRILILLTIWSLLGACKKQLNVYPTTSVVDGNVITDQQSAQAVLNGVYYKFASGVYYSGTLSTGWTSINEHIPSELVGTLVVDYTPPFDSLLLGARFAYSDSIWNYGYALVNAANGFIKNVAPVTNISAAAKRQMLAEAKFLRAFANSELLLYYGQYNNMSSQYGIIVRDTFVTSQNLNLPRSSVAAAYTFILSDLDSAINGLPSLNTSIGYANASAAKLLKAQVLINRGASGDYAQVIGLTNDIITNGPFSLEDSLKDIFLTKGFASQEVMLGIQPYPNETLKFDRYIGNNAERLVSDSMVSLLTDDARNQWVYKYAFSLYIYDSAYVVTKYYSGDPNNVAQTPLSAYCYVFRLSEAYLSEAEAITLSNGDLVDAKTLLTTEVSHAGAGKQEMTAVANASTASALQLEIVKENLRNFAFENGEDWYALRRLPFATIQNLNPTIQNSNHLIFPIPSTELIYNNVIQNPGY
jgi:starch-binding outer membrane protein, SusD/RagB family